MMEDHTIEPTWCRKKSSPDGVLLGRPQGSPQNQSAENQDELAAKNIKTHIVSKANATRCKNKSSMPQLHYLKFE